jgi:hypothetical protein
MKKKKKKKEITTNSVCVSINTDFSAVTICSLLFFFFDLVVIFSRTSRGERSYRSKFFLFFSKTRSYGIEEEKKVSMLLSSPTARLPPTVVIGLTSANFIMSFAQRTYAFICFIEKSEKGNANNGKENKIQRIESVRR